MSAIASGSWIARTTPAANDLAAAVDFARDDDQHRSASLPELSRGWSFLLPFFHDQQENDWIVRGFFYELIQWFVGRPKFPPLSEPNRQSAHHRLVMTQIVTHRGN